MMSLHMVYQGGVEIINNGVAFVARIDNFKREAERESIGDEVVHFLRHWST